MATPARKLEQLREQLFDHSVRKHELWLHGVRKELEGGYRRGELDAPLFHDLLGVVYGHLEDYEAAVRHGRLAVEMAPDFKIARHNLAVSLGASGRAEEAIEILEGILHQGLGAIDDFTTLVAAYANVGRWKSARKALLSAMESSDLHNVDHLWRLTLASAQAGKHEQAVEFFGRYLAARAGHPDADVTANPLSYVLHALAENDRLKDVPAVPEVVADAIQRLTVRHGGKGGEVLAPEPSEARDVEASAVFDAFAPARRRATEAVLPDAE